MTFTIENAQSLRSVNLLLHPTFGIVAPHPAPDTVSINNKQIPLDANNNMAYGDGRIISIISLIA